MALSFVFAHKSRAANIIYGNNGRDILVRNKGEEYNVLCVLNNVEVNLK